MVIHCGQATPAAIMAVAGAPAAHSAYHSQWFHHDFHADFIGSLWSMVYEHEYDYEDPAHVTPGDSLSVQQRTLLLLCAVYSVAITLLHSAVKVGEQRAAHGPAPEYTAHCVQ